MVVDAFHDWSDKDFDWKGLNDLCEFMYQRLKFHRIAVHQVKEKYGTLRVYVGPLYLASLHQLFYPTHCFNRFPKWLWILDCNFLAKYIFNFKPIVKLTRKWHRWAYRKAYKDALKLWPNLRDEILCCADWPEYLKGL